MIKNKIFGWLFGILSILLIFGLALFIIMLLNSNHRNNIFEVKIESGQNKIVEFKSLAIIPGEEYGYTLKLKADITAYYDLTFKFEENEVSHLKNFLFIKIILDNEEIYNKQFKECLNEQINLSYQLYDDKYVDFKIVYYMPKEIGNEAAGTKSSFELKLSGVIK